jgi:hypothetical protein
MLISLGPSKSVRTAGVKEKNDAPWRAFAAMADYRAWCEQHLPEYLGFKRRA